MTINEVKFYKKIYKLNFQKALTKANKLALNIYLILAQ